MFTDSTEASGRAETEIHCDSLCLCVSNPHGLERVGRKSEHIWKAVWCVPPGNLLGKEMVVSSHEGPKQCVKDRFCVPKRGSKLPSVFGDHDDGYFT